jgi:hypothetical protein
MLARVSSGQRLVIVTVSTDLLRRYPGLSAKVLDLDSDRKLAKGDTLDVSHL